MLIPTIVLRQELEWANKFVEKKATIPILQNVLLEAEGRNLTVTGTDREVAGRSTNRTAASGSNFAVAVPVRGLIEYLKQVEEDEVALSVTGANWLIVDHGSGQTRVAGMSKESYPELPKLPADKGVTLKNFAELIPRVSYAISAEESRFTLNGALLELNSRVRRLVAADGHRMSAIPVECEGETTLRVLIRKPALQRMADMEGDVLVTVDQDHIFADYGNRQIIARKLTGNFPDVDRVIEKERPSYLTLPVKETIKALNRVLVYADARSRAIRIKAEEPSSIRLYASSVEYGEAEANIPGIAGQEFLAAEIGLNGKYLLDFLESAKPKFSQISLAWTSPKHSVSLLTADGQHCIVMPMRI